MTPAPSSPSPRPASRPATFSPCGTRRNAGSSRGPAPASSRHRTGLRAGPDVQSAWFFSGEEERIRITGILSRGNAGIVTSLRPPGGEDGADQLLGDVLAGGVVLRAG